MNYSEAFLRLSQESRARVREVRLQELRALLDGQRPPTLVDVREDREWLEGHIPGAKHLSRGLLERDIERYVAGFAEPLVLYCGSGLRSAMAAESLQRMGFTDVRSFAEGWVGWKRAGLPVASSGGWSPAALPHPPGAVLAA